MPKPWRPFKSEREADKFCDARNAANRRARMAASEYDTEKTEEGWVVNHYVMRSCIATYGHNGELAPSNLDAS